MSHFSVAVITKGIPTGEQIEKLMAPYQENNMEDCPKEYLEFVKTEKEEGEWNEEAQDYGYYENPNSKWDWYQVGGRFAGCLRIPSDIDDYGITQRDPYRESDGIRSVDSARVKDIITQDKKEIAKLMRKWELIVEKAKPVNQEEKDIVRFEFFKPEYYIQKYGSKEKYAEIESTFHTWAIITKDGQWHEPGKMGWFGVSEASDQEEIVFIENFKKYVFDNAEDDDYLTVVDCHI